ncbi:hypothetical protein CASFOL_022656 [Castilleja foliolosa]|uniref:Uncharacterized protein n=1 Tax=Castilleja foliolosa TaxID=1961234 RepID=A0ABD3CDI5_9LAMI
MDGPDPARQNTIDDPSEALFHSRRRCCFSFTCLDRGAIPSISAGSTWWKKIRAADTDGGDSNSLWARGVGALKKIREWSEILAGPRWKTFIRRFNRNRPGRHANFQYDPLSYAMNFDDGQGQNGHLDEEGEDGYYYGQRNFSSRYAKGSMDLSKDGPTFV